MMGIFHRAPDKREIGLHIRGSIEDNSKIIFLISRKKTLSCDPNETVLMMSHKMCFNEEIWLTVSKLSLLPLLIWSSGNDYTTCIK